MVEGEQRVLRAVTMALLSMVVVEPGAKADSAVVMGLMQDAMVVSAFSVLRNFWQSSLIVEGINAFVDEFCDQKFRTKHGQYAVAKDRVKGLYSPIVRRRWSPPRTKRRLS